jgi:hypothetical protein
MVNTWKIGTGENQGTVMAVVVVWVNAGRATDCGRTLRVASYGAGGGGWDVLWRAGLEEEVPNVFGGGKKRRRKKKKKRNAPNSAGKDVLHPPSNFFFTSSSLTFLSLFFLLSPYTFSFVPSFVCSFLSFFVIGMSWSASFRHSFGGHQGRSSFSSPFSQFLHDDRTAMEIPHSRNRSIVNFVLKRFWRQI